MAFKKNVLFLIHRVALRRFIFLLKKGGFLGQLRFFCLRLSVWSITFLPSASVCPASPNGWHPPVGVGYDHLSESSFRPPGRYSLSAPRNGCWWQELDETPALPPRTTDRQEQVAKQQPGWDRSLPLLREEPEAGRQAPGFLPRFQSLIWSCSWAPTL